MKNIYNFNVPVEVPKKSIPEQILFLKWSPILRSLPISNEVIEDYKKDLLTLKLKPLKNLTLLLLLISGTVFSQTAPKYTYYVKLNKLLTTTKVDTSLYKLTNVYKTKEFKNNNDALAHGLKVGEFYSLPLVDGISLIAIVKPKQPDTQGSITNNVSYLSKEK